MGPAPAAVKLCHSKALQSLTWLCWFVKELANSSRTLQKSSATTNSRNSSCCFTDGLAAGARLKRYCRTERQKPGLEDCKLLTRSTGHILAVRLGAFVHPRANLRTWPQCCRMEAPQQYLDQQRVEDLCRGPCRDALISSKSLFVESPLPTSSCRPLSLNRCMSSFSSSGWNSCRKVAMSPAGKARVLKQQGTEAAVAPQGPSTLDHDRRLVRSENREL